MQSKYSYNTYCILHKYEMLENEKIITKLSCQINALVLLLMLYTLFRARAWIMISEIQLTIPKLSQHCQNKLSDLTRK